MKVLLVMESTDEKSVNLTSQYQEESLPSVTNIMKALYQKIMRHKGGMTGLWNDIKPIYKFEEDVDTRLNDNDKRLTLTAYKRAVNRLKNPVPENDKMTFGIRGNIFLMRHIYELLGIKDIFELDNCVPYKFNIEKNIFDTNVKLEEISNKINELSKIIETFENRTTRFPANKVYRDWEQILIQFNNYFNNGFFHNNFGSYNNILLEHFQNSHDLYFYYHLLSTFKAYFVLEKGLLPSLYKRLSNTLVDNRNDNFIHISPLVILYFALLVHKKFLTTLFDNLKYDFFVNYSLDESFNQIENKELKMITGSNLGKYILDQNNNILKYLKTILSTFNNSNKIIASKNYNTYLKETLSIFIDIYSSHADCNNEALYNLLGSIKSIKDLYSRMSLGEPFFFYITRNHINRLSTLISDFEILESSLK